MDISQNVVLPKKRGRKPKNQALNNQDTPPVEKPPPKKRGRKPKGGKIVSLNGNNTSSNVVITNIILHLKCSLNDIFIEDTLSHDSYNPNIENIESFSKDTLDNFSELYELENKETDGKNKESTNNEINVVEQKKTCENQKCMKGELSSKINKLQYDLNIGQSNVKSACFWCTENFDTPTIYIPKYKSSSNNKYVVYGCFCSPECAAAHLMNENINDSEKFERYHLLNYIYSSIYNYNKNIKPAPNPYYTLSKFMGNLSITEYRALSEYEKLILVIDKPLTRSIPQLFEDNDNYNITNKNSKINSFKVRKNNNISKAEILNNNFGL